MRSTKIIALLSSSSISVLGIAAPSFAADADNSDSSPSLTEIIVTAEKRSEPLKEVPMSVTALAGDELDKLQARDFADIAALVPGLSLVDQGPGISRLTLRGQNSGGDGSTVAVYVDESPFGSSSALLNGSILTGDFDPWDLQRVEVLRGPQGTLYGANSEGGLLKYVTNPPELGTYSGAIEVNGETVAHGQNEGDVRGMVNIPLGSIAAFRVSAYDEDLPGFIKDPQTGKTDVNSGHKSGGRASFLVDPVDSLSIRLTASDQQIKTNGTDAVDVDPATLQYSHGDLTQERFVNEPSTFKYQNYNVTVDWNPGPFSVLSTTSYGVLNTEQLTDATSSILAPPSTTLGDLLTGAFGEPLGSNETNVANLKKFTQEIRVASPTSDSTTNVLDWQLGGYYTHETGLIDQNLNALDLPSGAVDPTLPVLETVTLASTYGEWAAFGDATYHFNSQFDIEAGGRWSTNRQRATEGISGALAATTSFSTPSNGDVWTYSVAPRWHVDANTMVYVRVATGYRPGGPNALPPLAPPTVPREYSSDSTVNYEIGLRSTQFNNQLSIDLAAFYVDWKKIQLLEFVDSFGVNGNGGTARSEGVEWKFEYTPLKGLVVSWTGAYTDAVLTSPAPAVNGVAGDPLAYVPRWSTTLDGEYEWAAFLDYRSFVGATWTFVDSRSTDFASSAATVPAQLQLPSYGTVGLRLGLENLHYSATLYGKNLGDVRGITSYFSSGAPGLQGDISVIQPRTIGLTLAAKF